MYARFLAQPQARALRAIQQKSRVERSKGQVLPFAFLDTFCACGMKEIGDHFDLHYSRVSRIIANQCKSKES
jgi:DNA-binding MarR family transcriptional regulator